MMAGGSYFGSLTRPWGTLLCLLRLWGDMWLIVPLSLPLLGYQVFLLRA